MLAVNTGKLFEMEKCLRFLNVYETFINTFK